MLFDDRDLRVFDNEDSRIYFKEILQSYYGQNYRATVVLLYSFVIYDLYIKLQNMANDGEAKAKNKLTEIEQMILDDEKYSKVETEIIKFFKDNCSVYFKNFVEDIDYLKNCRNKCAHLKVDDNSLFVPSDYHARMLICSMYDHILSVKAPFITDLFSIAKDEVEDYSNLISHIRIGELDESIQNTITNKYLKRMTYDSMKKSYKTFIKLLFKSDEEECKQFVYGLYAFAFSMTDYFTKNYSILFNETIILNIFSSIEVDALTECKARLDALSSIVLKYPLVMDILRSNKPVFDYVSGYVLSKSSALEYYNFFYPREQKTVYEYFKEHVSDYSIYYIKQFFDMLKNCENFNIAEFSLLMVEKIPKYNGFDLADTYMDFIKDNIEKLDVSDIEKILNIYLKNKQCTLRARHKTDYEFIRKYIDDKKSDLPI